MKRRLNLYILSIVFVCSAIISGLLFSHVLRLLKKEVASEKRELTLRIENEMLYFQTTLELVEQQIISIYKVPFIKWAERLNSDWENVEEVPFKKLEKEALGLKVDQLFIINKDGIIKNTTLLEELNYDLKLEGAEFYSYFQNLFISNAFQIYSLGISSVDNSLTIYCYYVPEDSQNAYEFSINLNTYLKNYKSPYLANGIFGQLKDNILKEKRFVKSIDIYNLDDAFTRSLINNNKELELTKRELSILLNTGEYRIETEKGEVFYSMLDLEFNKQGFLPKLVLQADLDYSKQIKSIQKILAFNLIILLLILLIVALTSPQIIDRLLINKISIINFNLEALRFANYGALKYFKGNDELSVIAENIENVKDSVVEREQQLKESKLLAEAADNLKSAFLGNMSHEIRTPLNAIVGFAQLLRDANPSPDDIEKYVGLINSNSNRLLQIINDIIDLSQVESGQLKLIVKPLCLSELFSELYAFAQSKLHSETLIFNTKSISVFIDNDKILVGDCITTDPYRLKQIMEQLIDNAIKFTCKGEIRMGFTMDDEIVELYVSDTGVGIAEENISKIFGRFVQAEDYLTREYGGTGLGLAICNELVRMLGGTIHVDTKLNEGSTFYIRIPSKGIE